MNASNDGLPRADDPELSVLGAVLIDPSCIESVSAVLTANDFRSRSNGLLFETMLRLGGELDRVSLVQELEARGILEQVGGRPYLAMVLQTVPSSANVLAYARQVRDAADRRRLIEEAAKLGSVSKNGSSAEIDRVVSDIVAIGSPGRDRDRPTIYTADSLADLELREPRFIVAGLLPEGLGILAGAPKLGKSWLVLAVLVAIAIGGIALGKFAVLAGDVLYLALEDTQRRMRKRLEQMLGGAPLPSRLSIVHEWPPSDAGGVAELAAWLKSHPEARLVVIDTAAKFLPRPKSGAGTKYDADYAAMGPLQSLAAEYGVTILVVTHKRKAEAPDLLETVNGSNGLTGCADTTMILRRERGKADAFLLVTGRDIDEQDLALRFDRASGLWSVLGDAESYRLGETNARIVDAVRTIGQPATPKEVSIALEESGAQARERTKKALGRLAKAGTLRVFGNGRYGLPDWQDPGSGTAAVPGVPVSPVSPSADAATEDRGGTSGTPGTTGTGGTRATDGTEGTRVREEEGA